MSQFAHNRCRPFHGTRLAAKGALAICVLFMAACAPPPPLDHGVLTALQQTVDRWRQEQAYSLKERESVDLLADDGILVDTNGRALVQFQDDLDVELFRGTHIEIGEIRQRPGDYPLVWLVQIGGHSRTELRAQAAERFMLSTSYATFRPTQPDTEIVVCHAEGVLTCTVVIRGAMEVVAQGKVVSVVAGEGTYILPGQPPKPPICANLEYVRTWLDELRSRSDVGDLGTIVAAWPQQSCVQAGGTPAAAALAPPEPPAETDAMTATDAAPDAAPATEAIATTAPLTATAPATADTVITATAAGTETEIITETTTATASATEPASTLGPAPAGMVAVAGGSYLVGSAVAADEYHMPAQAVELASFWIDAAETTNSQYAAYITASGAAPPATWAGGQPPAGHEQHPVRGLTWIDADAFCRWAGKRLPSEAEWEAAARGPTTSAVPYPWGDDPSAGGQTGELPLTSTHPVGTAAFNRSPVGAYDMAGNVWEWVGEPYAPVAENLHVLHGGRFGLLRDIAYRQTAAADDLRFSEYAGVRCAADP